MATTNETTVTIPHSAAKVHAALSTAEYWDFIAQNLFPEAGEVHSFDSSEAVLYEVLPLEFLPEAVHSMISQALKLKRVVKVGALEGDAFSAEYTADVKGTPADFGGSISYSGADSTTAVYNMEVNVKIPFMGEAIEGKVGEYLDQLFEREAELTAQWIEQN